ncbi:hypothetical protein BMS3Bbin02_01624 [bacterium BMS3Bbin02]|nr:hypothetical protein BMS3Bbin02_01624 [bacterium BMS3Bbin02]
MNYTTPTVVKTALAGALSGGDDCWDGSIYYCVKTS